MNNPFKDRDSFKIPISGEEPKTKPNWDKPTPPKKPQTFGDYELPEIPSLNIGLIPVDLHKEVKLLCVNRGITIKSYVIELIKKDLGKK